MSREESDQLQAEWREDVRGSLAEIKAMLEGKEERIRKLENAQSKQAGFLIAIQALGAVGIWFMNKITNSGNP